MFVVAADLIDSMAVERLVERANAGQKNSADDCRVWHDGRARFDWHDLHVWLALVSAGHQQPSWCPSVSESDAGVGRKREALTPFLFLRLTFGTRRRLILRAGFFVPFLTL